MSTGNTQLTGPVQIRPDSEARIALELAKLISTDEGGAGGEPHRKYWLTLYHQCRKATTDTHTLKNILEAGD